MAGALINSLRLARAGLVFAQHGVRFVPEGASVPPEVKLILALTAPIRLLARPFHAGEPKETRVANALTRLGPSYIKLGQFLATRADVIFWRDTTRLFVEVWDNGRGGASFEDSGGLAGLRDRITIIGSGKIVTGSVTLP